MTLNENELAGITEKLMENHFRWFGHVQRKPIEALVKRVDQTT